MCVYIYIYVYLYIYIYVYIYIYTSTYIYFFTCLICTFYFSIFQPIFGGMCAGYNYRFLARWCALCVKC